MPAYRDTVPPGALNQRNRRVDEFSKKQLINQFQIMTSKKLEHQLFTDMRLSCTSVNLPQDDGQMAGFHITVVVVSIYMTTAHPLALVSGAVD